MIACRLVVTDDRVATQTSEQVVEAFQQARFSVGQPVHHRLFGYRGVIYDVDPRFLGTEEWYDQVARSRPPKDAPWYRVLVHDTAQTTYVAERNLEAQTTPGPITHPALEMLFEPFDGTRYPPRRRSN